MCYGNVLLDYDEFCFSSLGPQGCLDGYLPDTFLVPVFFSSQLKTCQTDLNCFVYIVMKTVCFILRETVQKLSAESSLACQPIHLHIYCGRVPVQLIAVHEAASLFLVYWNQI